MRWGWLQWPHTAGMKGKKHQRGSAWIKAMSPPQPDWISIKNIPIFIFAFYHYEMPCIAPVYQTAHTEEPQLSQSGSCTFYVSDIWEERSSLPDNFPSVRQPQTPTHSRYRPWMEGELLDILRRRKPLFFNASTCIEVLLLYPLLPPVLFTPLSWYLD